MNHLFGTFHQLLRLGDAAFDVLEAESEDEAVADTLVHDKFHNQVCFPAEHAVPIRLMDGLFASDGAEYRDGAEFIDVVVDWLHSDGAHVCDKEAGMERT